VLLTPAEKQMAREVCVAFGQGVSSVLSKVIYSSSLTFIFVGKSGDCHKRDLGCQFFGTCEPLSARLSCRH